VVCSSEFPLSHQLVHTVRCLVSQPRHVSCNDCRSNFGKKQQQNSLSENKPANTKQSLTLQVSTIGHVKGFERHACVAAHVLCHSNLAFVWCSMHGWSLTGRPASSTSLLARTTSLTQRGWETMARCLMASPISSGES